MGNNCAGNKPPGPPSPQPMRASGLSFRGRSLLADAFAVAAPTNISTRLRQQQSSFLSSDTDDDEWELEIMDDTYDDGGNGSGGDDSDGDDSDGDGDWWEASLAKKERELRAQESAINERMLLHQAAMAEERERLAAVTRAQEAELEGRRRALEEEEAARKRRRERRRQRQHARVEEAEQRFRKGLAKGFPCVLHSRGRKAPRVVFSDRNCTALFWNWRVPKAPEAKWRSALKHVDLAETTEIREGLSTPNLELSGDPDSACTCISLIGPFLSRHGTVLNSVDLQVRDVASRDALVSGFATLLRSSLRKLPERLRSVLEVEERGSAEYGIGQKLTH